jgi:hypothetical protein
VKTDQDRQAWAAEITQERHPSWCSGDPAGCDGVHFSREITAYGSDEKGQAPIHVYAIADDRNGDRQVEMILELSNALGSVKFTEGETRALAAVLTSAANMLAAPGPTWSWPLEQVEAYAAAVRDHQPAEPARGAR